MGSKLHRAKLLDSLGMARRAVAEACQDMADAGTVIICHGPPRCSKEAVEGEEWEPCLWCYKVEIDDPRTDEQIVADMEKEQ